MKKTLRRSIIGFVIVLAAYFAVSNRYWGWELARDGQLLWSDSEAYIVVVRGRQGRVRSPIRLALQIAQNYPYSGIPADDNVRWIEVIKLTASSAQRSSFRGFQAIPVGVLDGQVYSASEGMISLWNEGNPTPVGPEVSKRFSESGETGNFTDVGGWSRRVVILGSPGSYNYPVTLDGIPIDIQVLYSADRKSIVAVRPGGSSEIIVDIDRRPIRLNPESYKAFFSDISVK